jgi:signal transduction histidine kinase
MTFNFSEKIRAGYLTAFLLLLISYGLTFYTTHDLSTQNRVVNHTNEVINNLEKLESAVKDAEIGFRGYVLMKDEHFLAPYYPSKRDAEKIYIDLQNFFKKDLSQQMQLERLSYLHHLTNEEYSIISQSINDFKDSDMIVSDSLKKRGYRGKEVMDSIRFTIGLMKQRENDNLGLKAKDVKSAATAIRIINLTSLIIAILIAGYSVISFNAENKAKKEAAKKTEEYKQRLEDRVLDLKKANQELVSLRSMEKFATTGRLARVIAHEIRNPLTNIGLAADQLKSELPENEDAAMLLEMINRNGTRINQLITDLLSSTKFSELNYDKTSINELLDEALELASDRVQLKKITVQKNYSKDICDIKADKEKIKIAFLNIIVNAVEAMPPERGLLRLKTQGKENKCIITITDNGTGMDKETVSKLFEPYFTNKAKGNGLGLTNTQNIILNHKGTIEVESELGKGTSFIITLNFPE